MNKLILMLVMVFLLAGVVSADRSLYNVVNISMPSNVVAGGLFEASFSFDYIYGGDNVDGSPLIIMLDIVSEEDGDYPVWKGDFVISGRVEKSWFFNILTETIEFNCSEEYNQTIEHPLDAQNVTAENGTFYCYNEEGDLMLNERDEVYLDIVSHHALYPGNYDISATMFYLTDERAPFVNISNKDLFDLYYREIDNVLVKATIEDAGGVSQWWSSVMINGAEVFSMTYDHFENGEYYFARNTPVDIVEDNYELFVFAEDENNNTGNDSVTLRIDRSAPEIELINWSDVIGGIFSIEVEVIDVKAGLDNSSVEYRLREMNGSAICPEGGVGSWDCYNSGWLILPPISKEDSFRVEVNTTEVGLNGEYWLEVRASDILGNEGILE